MADDRSRGVHLTDKQLVFVFMASTVVAVVVFLCGVMVGRGVQAARGTATDAAMMTPPQAVSDGQGVGAPVSDMAPPMDAGKSGAVAAVTATDLKSADGPGKTPPPETLKAKPEPPAAKDPAPPPEVSEEVAGPVEPAAATGAAFTVQVAAVKKRTEADAIVKHLKTKGYDARVVVPEANDKVAVFRVRLGPYKTQAEADGVAHRIEREDKKYKPWVTR